MLSKIANREIGIIDQKNTRHVCSYMINNFKDIYEIIIPIFNKYFMTTPFPPSSSGGGVPYGDPPPDDSLS